LPERADVVALTGPDGVLLLVDGGLQERSGDP